MPASSNQKTAYRVAENGEWIRITESGEQRTGQDGWATVRLAPQRDFPLRRGYSVQFFVRARKGGDNLLAGVSTRRLVQVRTAR